MAHAEIHELPTPSNPRRKSQLLQSVLPEMDGDIALLGLVAQAAALAEAEDGVINGLTALHKRLTAQINRLFSLT